MDSKAAIELLKNMLGPLVDYAEMVGGPPGTYGTKYVYQDPEDYAIEEAIKALGKQLPKRIKHRRILYDFNNNPYAVKGNCPCCGQENLVSISEQYCPKCGQKLKWGK